MERELFLSYGNKLKSLRLQRKWTQKEAVNKIGVSKQTYSHYENEKRVPSLQTIMRISDLFEVSIDEIISAFDRFSLRINGKHYSISEVEGQFLLKVLTAYRESNK